MVAHTLFLKADERTLFDRLPESMQEGWSVQEDVMDYVDSPDRRRVRMSAICIQDPRLKAFHDRLHASITLEEATQLLQDLDVRTMHDVDVREIVYALGPDVLSAIIALVLRTAASDEDLLDVAAYSTARHLFFARHV